MTGPQKYWLEVVGVVNNVADEGRLQGYRPQGGLEWVSLFLRAKGNSQALAPAVRQALAELDPDLPLRQFQTAKALMGKLSVNEAILACLVAGFGVLGTLLAAIGIYGVTSQAVSRRTNELGIRMALGAQRSSVLWLVLRSGLRLGLCGALLGIAGSYALMHVMTLMANVLRPEGGTIAQTWIVMAGAAFVLIAVALSACWLPARRATRIDPMTALRSE
jgi:ABC-type lipoprotein release transport system permease subunit